FARARTNARVVAVTGSVGKTSTKEMLRDMLIPQGKTHASVASYNNHWGVPLTLARMPADTEFAVIEIGMNNPGEISPLSKMARPHVAMVTTVAAAHLAAFDGIDQIAVEKASIIDGLEQGGVAVFNGDIPTKDVLARCATSAGIPVNWFGETADFARLSSIEVDGNTTCAQVQVAGVPHVMNIQSAGQHFAMNALGALACVALIKADPAAAARNVSNWVPVIGRGAREVVTTD
ncbi:MAG: Mur ligase family protein, partial [Paracoccaceae bacterium]